MLKLNTDKWIERGVCGKVVNLASVKPFFGKTGSSAAESLATCGITYNIHLGDPVLGWSDGIIEPGTLLACLCAAEGAEANTLDLAGVCRIGNKVRILLPEAGAAPEGTVIGASCAVAGAVLMDLPERLLQRIHSEQACWITTRGAGLQILEFPSIAVFGVDPESLNRFDLQQAGRNHIMVPVTRFVPADYFIPLSQEKPTVNPLCYFNTVEKKEFDKIGLETLKFGDFIAISDLDYTAGFKLKKSSVSIGIVTLAPVSQWDVGFGVNIILSCTEGKIVPAINPHANLGHFLQLGRYRKAF